jgi:hypothetical protein
MKSNKINVAHYVAVLEVLRRNLIEVLQFHRQSIFI